MASFSASANNTRITKPTIRIEKVNKTDMKETQNKTKEVWAKAKSFAHDRLWFDYVLPGFLQSNGIDTRKMDTSEMVSELSDLWDTVQYEVNGQLSVIMEFTHQDSLSDGYTGEHPSKYDADSKSRIPVVLNALATIGSNDFRYYVMTGDEWTSPLIPKECFFGTYPLKYKGEIQKGKFRCVLKLKK